MRVLIADDQAIFRRGLMETVSEAFSMVSFGEARTVQEALDQARKRDWDLVILDVRIPAGRGLAIVNEFKRLRPRLRLLLLTVHAQQFARQAIAAGADGCLSKNCWPEELNKAIKRVLGGGQYISPTLTTNPPMARARDGQLPLYEFLSDREFQVLRMIASGKTITVIAEELSLSVKTVSTYRARILEKTGMKTNAELIRAALQAHVVD
ncbi:MAG TPA: response regulator transcription factor [Candidatus Acidoferrales bacterium]|nr:response regulator transcription factor [Candidatus Acidoferrales bacterium]